MTSVPKSLFGLAELRDYDVGEMSSEVAVRKTGFWTGLKAFLVYFLFALLRWTWRLEEDPLPDEAQKRLQAGLPVVFAHFHEDEWAMLAFYAKRDMTVLVSLSEDGGIMTRFLERLGYRVFRGSSSRGGASGLLQLIRGVREQSIGGVSLAVDGPRGPRRRVKKGVFKLAESLEAPIVSGGAMATRPLIFKRSWSKAFVPLPFSRIRLSYSPLMPFEDVKKFVERDDYATLGFELENKMKTAKSMALEKLKGATPTP